MPTFSPGFRISSRDVLVLCAGGVAAIVLGIRTWWWGMIVGMVVLHFFLFCNVFRISRVPELIWGGTFIVLVGMTMLTGSPGWVATPVLSLLLGVFLIWRETGKAHYHGTCWRIWNPNLPEWWKARLCEEGLARSDEPKL